MDTLMWILTGIAVAAVVAILIVVPRFIRSKRQDGSSGLSGIVDGYDAIWRPTSAEAHAEWEQSMTASAPAPAPTDPPPLPDARG